MFNRLNTKEGDALFVVICFIVTMAVSSLSWFLLEKPINSLKDKLAANPTPAQAAGKSLHSGADVAVEGQAASH
jgi:peptidoglycan/LPS O-acetylase OafA/YrhL